MEWLYTAMAAELFLGGGGRLTEIGPFSLRMVLFAVGLFAMVRMLRNRAEGGYLLAVLLAVPYILVHIPSALQGMARGADGGDVFNDLQPTLYWAIAPFFAGILQSQRMILRTAWLIVASGIVLAVPYLLVLAGLSLGYLNFYDVYAILASTPEFFFRGESFIFYKGFLYLAIACVFLLARPQRRAGLAFLVVGAALVLTMTRGFVLALSVSTVLMLFTMRRWTAFGVATTLCGLGAFAVWAVLPDSVEGILDQREMSVSVRMGDLSFILANASPLTLLFGEGFGAPINGRQNIENSYLWMVWKMGIPAVLFWFAPLVLSWRFFRRVAREDPNFNLACAFFFGMVLVYVQTATNPYLNNPIGLSYVLIALFSLRTLALGSSTTVVEDSVLPMANETGTRPRMAGFDVATEDASTTV